MPYFNRHSLCAPFSSLPPFTCVQGDYVEQVAEPLQAAEKVQCVTFILQLALANKLLEVHLAGACQELLQIGNGFRC